MDPHGGVNVTYVPPNQPVYSNGTGIEFYCDKRYTIKGGIIVTPVTCGADGKWQLYGMQTTCYRELWAWFECLWLTEYWAVYIMYVQAQMGAFCITSLP